jgi:beta-lactamase regulating signal transducer with metallopeptidase domain
VNGFELANALAATALSVGLNSLWLGLLAVVLAAGALRAVPRSNAATRYAVWFTALLLTLAMPVLLLLVPQAAPVPGSGGNPAVARLTVPVSAEWPVYAVLAWLAVAALLLARVAWSMCHIVGLKRRAAVVGRRGNIRLLASPEVRVPMAAGFFRRAVVFPQWLLAELTPEEFDQVLSHEMAHLRRGDDWTQLFQAMAQAVLFFNPVLYWIGRRLKIEREMACDDWVVSATGQPRPYAACLTHLHELTRRASAPQLAPGVTARTRWQISARVEALLEANRSATPRFGRSGWLAAAALVSAALLVATQTPQLVGVQQLPPASIQFARLSPPAAPILTVARAKAVPPQPRRTDAGYVLVRAWSLEAPQSYFVIAVVFFEPPPPVALNRI